MTCRVDSAFKVVRGQLRKQVPFEHIEADIERCDLDEEEKAVLWLYAWCGGQASELRSIVLATEAYEPTS